MYKCAEIIRNSRVSFWGNGKNLGQNHGPMIFQLAMSYFINHSHDHLVMTNIAMENPLYMEVSSWENHLFLWAMASMAMLVITRGYHQPQPRITIASCRAVPVVFTAV